MKGLLSTLMAVIIGFLIPINTVGERELMNYLDHNSVIGKIEKEAETIQTIFPEAERIATTLIQDYGEYTISYKTTLYNIYLTKEAICFSYSPCGYVIVNMNDFSVPEFSPYADAPFMRETSMYEKNIYVGPLNYYRYNEITEEVIEIKTGLRGKACDFKYAYTKSQQMHCDETRKIYDEAGSRSTEAFFTNYAPVTWASNYLCGLDACAIVLKYLDSHHESGLLGASFDDNGELQAYLLNNGYIPNEGTFASDIVSGIDEYSGINAFFSARGSSFTAAYDTYHDYNPYTIANSVANDCPVIIGTDPATDWNYNDHWVINYGCILGTTRYFVINDGWGNDGIFVTVLDDHYDDYIIFY